MYVLAFVRPTKVEQLRHLDAEPASPLSQASLKGFGNAVLAITSYCNAADQVVLLPALPGSEPSWYSDLNTNLQNMKGHTRSGSRPSARR